MATLQFSRNTKVYLEQGSNIWEIPVQDGYSFSQGTEVTEITLNEMEATDGTSRRSRSMFTDAYAPAEWSFSTYVRPNAGTLGSAVEEALWANFVATPTNFTPGTPAEEGTWTTPGGTAIAKALNTVDFDFTESNTAALGTFTLYFVLGACGAADANYAAANGDVTIYQLTSSVINSASIDFEIDGIAMINWSGFASLVEEVAAFDATGAIDGGVADTGNYIRNRLTTLGVTAADTATFPGTSSDGVYNVTLTGGNITFENNITYLTPETLCVVNQPIEHVTGTRSISGNFTCYLDGTTGGSEDLFEDIQGATTKVRNNFGLVFGIGGASAPKLEITLPQAHLEIPTHSIEDVISVDVTFHGLPSDPSNTDEATLLYTGA